MSQTQDLKTLCSSLQSFLNQQTTLYFTASSSKCPYLPVSSFSKSKRILLHKIHLYNIFPGRLVWHDIDNQLKIWLSTDKAQWVIKNIENILVDGYLDMNSDIVIYIFSYVDDSMYTQYTLTWEE